MYTYREVYTGIGHHTYIKLEKYIMSYMCILHRHSWTWCGDVGTYDYFFGGYLIYASTLCSLLTFYLMKPSKLLKDTHTHTPLKQK